MTLDLISRAEARIAEINQERLALDYEQYEIETALKVLQRFLGEASDLTLGETEGHSEPQPATADGAVEQTGPESNGPFASVAEPEAVESSATLSDQVASVGAGTDAPIQPEAAVTDEPESEADAAGDFERDTTQTVPADLTDGDIVADGLSRSAHSSESVTLTSGIEPKPTQREIFDRCIADHPDWPARIIAERTGLPYGTVRGYASTLKITLPSQWDYDRANRPEPPAEPAEADKPISGTQVQPEAERPSLPIENRPVKVVHMKPAAVRPSASVRFYVVDDKGRFLHQSLQRSPTDDGPLMTASRQWAWHDNAQRFEGAAKVWPEIIALRKDYPQP